MLLPKVYNITHQFCINVLTKCQENTHEKRYYEASKQLVSEETHYEDILYS